MKNTIKSILKEYCYGCGACLQVCPKDAIKMQEDKEGFLYPTIDKNKCISCGRCYSVCPVINYDLSSKKIFSRAYAIKNKNINELKKSSSGGVFIAIAKYVIDHKGIVYGAAYDKYNNVNHISVKNKKDLLKLQGSKYVQSNINNIFKDVKKNLDNKKLILFTGTPCQIRGLKNYLNKDYNNLITCDLVCHGVPSQKLFKKYLNYIENKYHKKIKKYDFRNKEKRGWGLTAKIIFNDDTIKYINSDFDPYYQNFLNCNTYRESCYNCKFSTITRNSDITLADYWGILSIHKDFYDENGVSLVLINSEKGLEIIKKIKNNIEIIETNLEYAVNKNKNLKQSSNRPKKRNIIYKKIDKLSSVEFIKKRLNYKINIKKIIKIFISNKFKKNIVNIKEKFK